MWSPTHVQVTVQKSRGLICKGKNGTNDAFVTIELGKEKFQTSVKQKSTDVVEWHEKCELLIPKQGNRAEVVLTALHHNFLGMDEFLGCIHLPLAEMDVYDRPKNRWIPLKAKPGKENTKNRGELEVKIGFMVKAGSLSDLSKKEKHKSSLGQLSQAAQSFGGSLISISSLDKRKGFKKLATKIGSKIGKISHKKEENASDIYKPEPSRQIAGDADPGVISEGESDDDFTLDELSHKGSGSSLNFGNNFSTRSVENISQSYDFSNKQGKQTTPGNPASDSKSDFDHKKIGKVNKEQKSHVLKSGSLERIIIGKEITRTPSPVSIISPEIIRKYAGKTKEDLLVVIVEMQAKLAIQQKHQRDLEDYLDNLLLRVMETTPRILQTPYISCKAQANFYN